MRLYMSWAHVKNTTMQQELNPAVWLIELNVELVKAYHLHVSLKKWTSGAHTARPQMGVLLSLPPPVSSVPRCCAASWYLQVLCGQVSCWYAEVGHLLRDKVQLVTYQQSFDLRTQINNHQLVNTNGHQRYQGFACVLLMVNTCRAFVCGRMKAMLRRFVVTLVHPSFICLGQNWENKLILY